MTQEQIQEQIAKFEKGLTNPYIPESAKETIKKKIEDLKSQIQKVEEVIEKKEEKIEKEEKAAQEDLEEVIKKFEKGLSNPNIPETAKDAMRKKIAAAKEKLAEAKKEMKEDKVEAEKEKKEIKKAVEKVEQLAKKAKKGKTPKKPAKPAKVKVEHKKREAKAEKRKSKIKGMTEDLMKIIRSNKYLKEKYAGKNVDLERDAHRAAKPFGYRFKGEHDLRDPKEVLSPKAFKAAVKSGRVYFEGRPNRSDKYPKGVPKHKSVEFADGGELEGHDVEIFFNHKNKVADPYTVIIDGSVYSMSGTSGAYSVNLYVGEIDEFEPQAVKGWGKKINFVNADPELIKQIETRFEEYAKGGETDYSKQTSDDFKLGEIVWDTDNG